MAGLGLRLGLGLGRVAGGAAAPWYTQGKADGIDPSLWADFANDRYAVNGIPKPFADIFTFTRSTTGTYFDANGVMQTAAINTPRFDHAPLTHAPLGLLVEGLRTNMCTYSIPTSGQWGSFDASVSYNNSVDPMGYKTASLTTISSTTNSHAHTTPTISFTSGTTYVLSKFVKAGTKDKVQLAFGSSAFGSQYTNFYLSGNGSVLATSGHSSYGIQYCGNGWYRIYVVAAATSTTSTSCRLYFINSDSATYGTSFLGNGTDSFYAWGGQCEVGAFPTSYIPTSGAVQSRAADIVTNSASNAVKFSDWYNQTEGSLFIRTRVKHLETNVLGRTAVSIEADAGNYMRVYGFSGSQNTLAEIKTAYSSVMAKYAQTMVSDRDYTHTVRFKTNDSAYFVNAQAKGVDTTCTLPTPTNMGVGYSPALGGQFFGHVKEIRYYPVAIADAPLQAATLDYLTEGDSYMAGYLGYGVAQSLLDAGKVLSNTSVGGSSLAEQVTRIEALPMAGFAPLIHCDGSINGYSTTEVDMALYQRIYDACAGNVVFITPCIYPAIAGTEMGDRTLALTNALVAAYTGKVVNLMELANSIVPNVGGHVDVSLLAADELHPNDLFADALAAAAVAKL